MYDIFVNQTFPTLQQKIISWYRSISHKPEDFNLLFLGNILIKYCNKLSQLFDKFYYYCENHKPML